MELIIDGKLMPVRNHRIKHDFPVCTVMQSGNAYFCYLNSAARKMFEIKDGVNWYVNENYVIGMPSKAINAFKANHFTKSGPQGYSFPSSLIRSNKVKLGSYKMYRYKSGFGFKHYEPLEEGEVYE